LLRKAVSVCIVVTIMALIFGAGELVVSARDFIEDRLVELGIPQQN